MITAAARTDLETSIQNSCRYLFLTSAIPDLVRQDGTPKQIEYLAAALQKEVARREENKRDRLVIRNTILHIRHLMAMNIVV